MRTVRGRSDHVVVVGAGLAGLSAALRLAGAGRRVTVLERAAEPGGRAAVWRPDGYAIDAGPTVLTMPGLIADALASVGESLSDWLTLTPVSPLYRARYADGSTLDVHADPAAMAAAVEELCGPAEAAGYLRFVTYLRRLYEVEMAGFIDKNLDSPLSLVGPEAVRLVAMGGFRRLAPKVSSFLKDERLQRLFSFQAMYAGVSPYQALAVYAVIAYMDSVAGVFFPVGGMHAVPRALAGAASKHGVEFRYSTAAASVELSGSRAVAVLTEDGERIPCDAVVLNPEQRSLLGLPGRERKLAYSPSAFLLLAGSTASYADAAHHVISFGAAWKSTFSDLLDRGRTMRDPSFLVSTPTLSDPSLAPAGRQSYYVLFPAPNLRAGPIDWPRFGPAYRDEVVRTLEARGWPGFGAGVEVERTITPADWAAQGMPAGTPFSAAHLFRQTGPFRPANLWGDNVVFAGAGTHPGVGVPTVLISGKLAAERITGEPSPGTL